ncbi:MAG: hypothetical protein IJZ57_02765, partial [Clostridia bacterium]|nr:hypothetical protein [Clostridia bacterium]
HILSAALLFLLAFYHPFSASIIPFFLPFVQKKTKFIPKGMSFVSSLSCIFCQNTAFIFILLSEMWVELWF